MGFELPHREKIQVEETKAKQRESWKTGECQGGVTSIHCIPGGTIQGPEDWD